MVATWILDKFSLITVANALIHTQARCSGKWSRIPAVDQSSHSGPFNVPMVRPETSGPYNRWHHRAERYWYKTLCGRSWEGPYAWEVSYAGLPAM
jgi:hypothetical protein